DDRGAAAVRRERPHVEQIQKGGPPPHQRFVLPTTTTPRRPIVGCTPPPGGHGDGSPARFSPNPFGEERGRSLNQFTARAAHGSRAARCRICRDASSHRLSAIIRRCTTRRCTTDLCCGTLLPRKGAGSLTESHPGPSSKSSRPVNRKPRGLDG